MQLHDDLLQAAPEGARHNADICPFCVEKASQSTASDPSGPGRPDVSSKNTKSTEGGDTPTMTDISQEAHEALLKKAVDDAVKATEAALATKTTEAASAATKVTELEEEVAGLKTDNDRLNSDLDAAQVKLKSTEDEVAGLKQAATDAEEKAKLAEVASKRADQVKNLKLFSDDYVSEKASKWASIEEAAWTEQVEEWKQLKPAGSAADGDANSDAASAMTGGDGQLTKEQQDAAAAGGSGTDKPKARRAALGLV